MEPHYSTSNCTPAYQLRWSLALFPNVPFPTDEEWLAPLNQALIPDGIRILDRSHSDKGALVLLLSTRPSVAPSKIVQRIKGRLQHLLRPKLTISWRRNFRLSTVGDANVQTVEKYVADQLQHHKMATLKSQQQLADFVWQDESVDLSVPIFSSHGQYLLGMHLVLVHAERWTNANSTFLAKTQKGILGTAKKYGCSPSKLTILADHLHVTLGFPYDIAPETIAISCMNNTSYFHDMQRLWTHSFYVGTIGPYDMNAVRRNIEVREDSLS